MLPLTEAQQILAEKARGYAFGAVWKRLRAVQLATHMDRDELRQEAMLAVCRAARTWREDGAASWTTYATAAVNHHLSHLCHGADAKKRQGHPRSLSGLDPDDMPAMPAVHALDGRLEAALLSLTGIPRATLVLRIAGLTNVEISLVQHRSLSQVNQSICEVYRLIRASQSGDQRS